MFRENNVFSSCHIRIRISLGICSGSVFFRVVGSESGFSRESDTVIQEGRIRIRFYRRVGSGYSGGLDPVLKEGWIQFYRRVGSGFKEGLDPVIQEVRSVFTGGLDPVSQRVGSGFTGGSNPVIPDGRIRLFQRVGYGYSRETDPIIQERRIRFFKGIGSGY